MSIEHAILGLLSWRPNTGYEIKKMFEGSPALYWSGNNNQIYTTLINLQHEELVSCETQFQESKPPRKIYSITAQGLTTLRAWLLTPPELPQVKHSFLIQLAWADQLSPEELDTLLASYEEEIFMQHKMLSIQKQEHNISPSGKPRPAYINPALARTHREAILWNSILENWVTYYAHELIWVRKLRQELQETKG